MGATLSHLRLLTIEFKGCMESQMNRRALLILFASSTTASAHSLKHGDIQIGHAWALPAVNRNGQVFFPMANNGDTPDALIAARSELCSFIEFRRNARYDDPPENEFSLPVKQLLPMRPSANHLRLAGLARPLVIGDQFAIILDFLNAGEIEISVHVEEKPGD
jgi:periplasmic copper chaperone A